MAVSVRWETETKRENCERPINPCIFLSVYGCGGLWLIQSNATISLILFNRAQKYLPVIITIITKPQNVNADLKVES
jgi:hypothetical protein